MLLRDPKDAAAGSGGLPVPALLLSARSGGSGGSGGSPPQGQVHGYAASPHSVGSMGVAAQSPTGVGVSVAFTDSSERASLIGSSGVTTSAGTPTGASGASAGSVVLTERGALTPKPTPLHRNTTGRSAGVAGSSGSAGAMSSTQMTTLSMRAQSHLTQMQLDAERDKPASPPHTNANANANANAIANAIANTNANTIASTPGISVYTASPSGIKASGAVVVEGGSSGIGMRERAGTFAGVTAGGGGGGGTPKGGGTPNFGPIPAGRDRGLSGTNLGFGAAVGNGGASHLGAAAGLTQGQALFDALLRVANSSSEEEDDVRAIPNNAVVSVHGTKGPAHQRGGSGVQHLTAEAKESAAPGAPGAAYAVTIDRDGERRKADAKREADAKKKNSPPITLVSFNEQLKAFKTLLVISGLHKDTSAVYRWWLRIVIWSCTVLCTINLGLQTRAYRSVLFDIALSLMHVWVSVAYEFWYRFLKKKHWQYLLCNQPSYEFFKVLGVLGYVGIAGIIGATAVITTGWIAPILRTWFDQMPQYHDLHAKAGDAGVRDFWFLALHGFWMTLIVISWACVCITSMFLFFLLIQAHKSDIDQYARHVVALFADNGAVRMSNQAAAAVIQLIVPVRRRLVITSRYFDHLSASFMFAFYLLLCGAVQNISDLLNGRANFDGFKPFQDALFIGLGLAALFCGLWAASSLASYWLHTVNVLNAIPTLAQVVSSTAMVTINAGGTGEKTYQPVGMTAGDLVVHSSVIQHLMVHPLCFQVYGVNLSKQTVLMLCFIGAQVLGTLAFILNYPLH